MSLFTAFAIYFIIWWITLFTILPWGVTSQFEEGEVKDGTEPSAPVKPFLFRKALATTVVAMIIFIPIYWIIVHSGWSIEDVPLFRE